jgi:hypothetical protein
MKNAISAALRHGGECGRVEAGPEDLLAAVARDHHSAAAFIFEQAGIAPARVVEEISRQANSASQRFQRSTRLDSRLLHVLDIAAGESKRLGHAHIGTEHVAIALARTNNNVASDVLARMGFTSVKAEAGLALWHKRGMPRQRNSFDRVAIRSPLLRTALKPFQAMARGISLGWKVYVDKSLGHPKFVTNPYPLYRKLRELQPVRRDPIAPVWVATSYDAVMTLARDPRFAKDPFAGERLPQAVREQLEVPADELQRTQIETVSMVFLDPPEHTRIRGIFSKAFTLKRIESLRPRIEFICKKRLDAAAGKGEMELMSELAAPLPVTVIAELLGFPPEDYSRIKKWSDEMAEGLALNPSAEAQMKAAAARDELRVYFDELVKVLQKNPGNNLVSALLADSSARLSREELFTNAVLLLAAGHETTTHLIGNGILALLRNPDQLRLLQNDPALIDSAIEEFMRYDPAVQWISRVAGEDIELDGTVVPRGEIVLGALGGANRDPKYFAEPDRLDIARKENRHLSFGAGPHFCLGATLARMEASIAILNLVTRFPKIRLAQKKIVWQKGLTFRGVKSLHLRLD